MLEPLRAVQFVARSSLGRGGTVLALGALLAAAVETSAVQAQQPSMTTVRLLTQDTATVDAKRVAAKDVAAHLTAQSAAQPGLRMIALEACPGVPPDAVQGMMQTLQKSRFMVVLDLKEPDPRLCR
jgi:hypothetical protein